LSYRNYNTIYRWYVAKSRIVGEKFALVAVVVSGGAPPPSFGHDQEAQMNWSSALKAGPRSVGAALGAGVLVLAATACGGGGSSPHANGPSPTLSSPQPTNPSPTSSPSTSPTTTTTTRPAPSARTGPASTVPAQLSSCDLPLTHDTNDGFHIAVPSGWELSTINGELEVENNVTASEAVLVVPAVQTRGLTAAAFFASQMSTLEAQAKSEGRTITVQTSTSVGGEPAVSFSAPINGQTAQGEASVEVLHLGSQLSSSELVFVAYWAPASTFAGAQGMLASIGRCYGPEPGSLYRVFQDQAFTYIMPPGWTVGDESQNSIDLHDGNTADVSYLLAEAVPATEVNSPQTMISYFLKAVGVGSVQALWTTVEPSQQEVAGTQDAGYEEFTGTLDGGAVHGLIYALTNTGAGDTSGVVRLGLAASAAWNSLNGSLLQMMGAIQHNFTQDLQQLQQINQQWQNFSGQVENFDDVLNSQQLVQDPSTGSYYEAPYSSYQSDGPDGAGYYLSNGERLNEVQRA
jgi:hypothetical protein